jgi:hypothetical protein
MESEGCASAVNVAENAYNTYASQYHVIANGTFVRVADGPLSGLVARAAGGALLGLLSCVPLEECSGVVNVAENAYTTYAGSHPTPENGTVVEGLPSGTYWLFNNGEREPTATDEAAVAIDDGGLSLWPIKRSSNSPHGTSPANIDNQPSASYQTTHEKPSSSMPAHGVLSVKEIYRSKSSALSRALVKCHQIKSRRKRVKCEAAAKRRYHSVQKRRRRAP